MKKSLLILSILTTLSSNSTSLIYKLDSCNNISTTKCPIVIQEYVSSDSASIPTPTCITPQTGELTKENYITVDHSGTSLDWAWVSAFNVQLYYMFGELQNELYAPETVSGGWREATTEEFTYFKNNIKALDFLNPVSGGYKIATTFFNSQRTDYNISDLNDGDISGDFPEGTTMDGIFSYYATAVYDTFYVRNSVNICD